jgi:hypothetical protein
MKKKKNEAKSDRNLIQNIELEQKMQRMNQKGQLLINQKGKRRMMQ